MGAPAFYNEMHAADGSLRAHYAAYRQLLEATPGEKINAKRAEADALRPQLSELQGYYANLDAYNAGIDECADTMSTASGF